jgi:hypothetical protein
MAPKRLIRSARMTDTGDNAPMSRVTSPPGIASSLYMYSYI